MKALSRATILIAGLISCLIGLPCVYAALLSFTRTDLPYTASQKLVGAILAGIFPLVVGILLLYYWFWTRPSAREAEGRTVPQETPPRPVHGYVNLPPNEVLRLLFGAALLWMGLSVVLAYLYIPNPFTDLPQPINPVNGGLILLFVAARTFWRVVKRQRSS
ncbi:MAG: hypothetical protein V1792_01235 [Pseudomonadota bacterium]